MPPRRVVKKEAGAKPRRSVKKEPSVVKPIIRLKKKTTVFKPVKVDPKVIKVEKAQEKAYAVKQKREALKQDKVLAKQNAASVKTEKAATVKQEKAEVLKAKRNDLLKAKAARMASGASRRVALKQDKVLAKQNAAAVKKEKVAGVKQEKAEALKAKMNERLRAKAARMAGAASRRSSGATPRRRTKEVVIKVGFRLRKKTKPCTDGPPPAKTSEDEHYKKLVEERAQISSALERDIAAQLRKIDVLKKKLGRYDGSAVDSIFEVDNALLQAPTTGLGYRLAMSYSAYDGLEQAPWGSTVLGRQIGQWVKVGERYLPLRVQRKIVLKQREEHPETVMAELDDDGGSDMLDDVLDAE